jgi:hypothetical protein
MTPAEEAPKIRLADLLRDAADWTPEHCRHVADVFRWLAAHSEGLTAAPMRDAAAQLDDLARAKEEHRAPLQKRINRLSESDLGVVEHFLEYLEQWNAARILKQLAGGPSRAGQERDIRELFRLYKGLCVSAQGALLTCARLLRKPGRDQLIDIFHFFRRQG